MVRRSQVSGLSVPAAEGNNEVHELLHMDQRLHILNLILRGKAGKGLCRISIFLRRLSRTSVPGGFLQVTYNTVQLQKSYGLLLFFTASK